MSGMDERRARLSPEKQALLAKRLSTLSTMSKASAAPQESPVPEAEPPLDLSPGNTAAPVSREVWNTMAETGEREARRLAVEPDLLADAAREPRWDEQSAAVLCTAFRSLGVFQETGEEWTVSRLIDERGVLPKHRKVLRRWMETLKEEGLLEERGNAWVALQPVPSPAFDALLSDEHRRYYGNALTKVLTGETHPLEFYLPGGSSSSVESSYRELPIFRYCNGICAGVLGEQVSALREGTRLRMIEIGAGTGGTTASLLPLLPPDRTVFCFTDVSRFFTDLGRKKFQEHRFLRYRELDIEKDPLAQGYPEAGFDWVVAAHVLHATRDIAETLEHVLRLLAPGGVLLLLEETRFQRKYNFSMGFLPGFDHFEDFHLRPLHPLLSAAQWREALLAAGFGDFATFTEPGSAADVMGVDVMIARKPGGD